jgi:hypothetical protein
MAVKIPVDADIRGVQRKVEELGKTIDKVSRVKWTPIDAPAIDRDVRRVQESFKRIYGKDLQSVRDSYTPPVRPARGGGSGGPRGGGGSGFGLFDTVGRQFTSGVGGGFQSIGSYAARGAAEGGGGLGSAAGFLRGGVIGAAAFGAYKLGSAVSEGIDTAKDRSQGTDVLKRQMGDVGISFDRLKSYADRLADGLGVNSNEFIKLESSLQKLSRTVESPESLGSATALGVGISRSYGLDSGAGGGFLGGMRNIDPKQNNRELALILADTIARSGMNARADEVMQAILSFSSATTSRSLSPGNVAAFGNAYGGLLSTHLPGMTPDTAQNLLMQANSGVMSMGSGAGEAGRAFMLSAFNRHGGLNPIQAQALAEGGLFGTRSSVFGSGGAISQFMGGTDGLANGAGANVSNFDAIKQQLGQLGGSKWMQLEGAQRLFGVQSLSQAAALMNLNGAQGNGLVDLMHSNNIDINKINGSGISRLGAIGAAGTDQSQLSAIFEDMKKSGSLTQSEIGTVSTAEKASPSQFRDALVQVASMKGQSDDQGTEIRNQTAALEDIKINTGDKLLTPLIAMSDTIVAAAGRGPQATAEKIINIREDEAEQNIHDIANARRQKILNRGDISAKARWEQVGKLDSEEKDAIAMQERDRASALSHARAPFEITIHNNVNVKTADGKQTTSSSRTNIAPPSPSGSKSVTIGTH